jgi:hypothetical protein
MELTFSCNNCDAIGYVSPLEGARLATCGQCGSARPIDPDGALGGQLQFCPVCTTNDLYIQKDFPQGLGLFIVLVGIAISTVFWYYEMPISAFVVLIISLALDFLMYHIVPDVTICYRCLSQVRGAGSLASGRFKPFDLATGERYRQERIRVQAIRERGAQAE